MATKQQMISVTEAAQRSGFGRAWLKRLCQRGEIAGAVKVGQQWCIPAENVPLKPSSAQKPAQSPPPRRK